MKIGYSKIGRSWNLDPQKWSTVGGDVDVWRTLWTLATRNPDDEFVLVGRNTCDNPQEVGLPPNVTNPWTERQPVLRQRFNASGINHPNLSIEEDRVAARILYDLSVDLFLGCDAHVVWAGQHGTSSAPIEFVGERLGSPKVTHPQDSTIYYSSYLVYGLNAWQNEDPLNREAIWLCPDVRNYLKARDVRWPLRNSVMAQFNQTRTTKYERFSESREYLDEYKSVVKKVENGHVWVANTQYTYDALEFTALPHPMRVPLDLETERKPFGMVVNENRKEVSRNRLGVMKEWVLPNFPDAEIWGKWSPKSMEELGIEVEVCPYDQLYDTMSRYYCTLTTPASGSGWMTSKFWESCLAGVICFYHPAYDTQGHGLPLKPNTDDEELNQLVRWLRPPNPDALKKAVDAVSTSYDTWRYLAELQRRYVERRYQENRPILEIEERIGLGKFR